MLLVGAGGFLLGRGTTGREPAIAPPSPVAAPGSVAVPAPASPPAGEEPRGILGRADLLALAATAADAAASGRDASAELRPAAGRRFAMRLPFGCAGPAGEGSEAATGWRYDEGEGVLRVRAAPITWMAEDWRTAAGPVAADAIEGFWVSRPWTSSEACPSVSGNPLAAGTEAVTLPGQTLGVAQFFTADGSRQGRRDGRAFETSARIAPEAVNAGAGFRLRLSGRIDRIPAIGQAANRPVLCRQPGGPEQRPICVIAVTLDEVAIERGADGEALATWNIDGQEAPESRAVAPER